MEHYLSIGEVAKLKGITIKALRYYEKIGILIPAHINTQTGYRYYSPEQLIILDHILVCLELNIPLKDFSNFMVDEHTLDLEGMLQTAEILAQKEIARIQRTIRQLKNVSLHLETTEKLIQKKPAIQKLSQKYYLVEPMGKNNINWQQYTKALTKLYQTIVKEQLNSFWQQGLLYDPQNEQIFAFGEIQPSEKALPFEVMMLSAGEYSCEYHTHRDTVTVFQEFFLKKTPKATDLVIFEERYGKRITEKYLDTQVLKRIRTF